MSETKTPYNEDLRRRLNEYFDRNPEANFDDIYTFVKEEALRSWKNGLETGRKRAVQIPNGKSAHVRGSALATGRLKPVQ